MIFNLWRSLAKAAVIDRIAVGRDPSDWTTAFGVELFDGE